VPGRRSGPGSKPGHGRLGWALAVLCGLGTSIVSATPSPPPLRMQFLQSISNTDSPLVRGYADDDPLLVRVPSRFFETGDVCAVTGCSMLCASLLGTSNAAASVPPVIAAIEELEQEPKGGAAASSGTAKSRPFNLRCRRYWADSRGIGVNPEGVATGGARRRRGGRRGGRGTRHTARMLVPSA
jgi:hypothetical protein